MIPFNDLIKAFYDRLAVSANKVSFPVYDEPPESAEMPYASIGEYIAQRDGSKSGSIWIFSPIIHLWSDEPGGEQIDSMVIEIDESIQSSAIDLAAFTTSNFRIYLNQIGEVTVTKENHDGVPLRHAVVSYQVRVSDF